MRIRWRDERELGRFDERERTKRDRGKERWRNMEEGGEDRQ